MELDTLPICQSNCRKSQYYANVSKTRTDSIQSAHHTYF